MVVSVGHGGPAFLACELGFLLFVVVFGGYKLKYRTMPSDVQNKSLQIWSRVSRARLNIGKRVAMTLW